MVEQLAARHAAVQPGIARQVAEAGPQRRARRATDRRRAAGPRRRPPAAARPGCASSWTCRRRSGRGSRRSCPSGTSEVDAVERDVPPVALAQPARSRSGPPTGVAPYRGSATLSPVGSKPRLCGPAPPSPKRPQGADLAMAVGSTVDVVMPQMGVSVSEGTVSRWLKAVGDRVEADETIVEISTDKVDTEVPVAGCRHRRRDPRPRGRDGARRDAPRRHPDRRRPAARAADEAPEPPAAEAATEEQPRRPRPRPAERSATRAGRGAGARQRARRRRRRLDAPGDVAGRRADGGRARARHRPDPGHRPRRPRHQARRRGASWARTRARPPRRPRRPPRPRPAAPAAPRQRRAGRARPACRRAAAGAVRAAGGDLPLLDDPQGHREAHDGVAAGARARHADRRGRHDPRRRPAQAAQAAVREDVRRRPLVPAVHHARRRRRHRPLAVAERRGPRRRGGDQALRQHGHGRRHRRRQGPAGAGDQQRRAAQPGRPVAGHRRPRRPRAAQGAGRRTR